MDDDLTSRAERALLGALITDPGLVPDLHYLEPRVFDGDRHRAVYTAIRSLRNAPAARSGERIAAIARAAGPHVSEEYVRELAASCPDPRHGTAYGLRVVQAALYRQIAQNAGVLGAQAASPSDDEAQATGAGADGGPQAPGAARHLGLVADALRRHAAPLAPTGPATSPGAEARQPDPSREQDADPVPETGGPARTPDQAAIPAVAVQPQAAPPARPASDQELAEEHVLTTLLRQHRKSDQILDFLPAAAFTSPDRQEIFRAIRRLRQAGQPVDELTVIWELATGNDSFTQAHGSSGPAPGTYATVTRLASASDPGQSPPKEARELLGQLDRRTAPGRQPARHAQPGQAPVQPGPSPAAGPTATQPPQAAGPQQHGPEPRR